MCVCEAREAGWQAWQVRRPRRGKAPVGRVEEQWGEQVVAALTASSSFPRSAGSPPTTWRRIILNTAELWHVGRDTRHCGLRAQDEQAAASGAVTGPGGPRL